VGVRRLHGKPGLQYYHGRGESMDWQEQLRQGIEHELADCLIAEYDVEVELVEIPPKDGYVCKACTGKKTITITVWDTDLSDFAGER